MVDFSWGSDNLWRITITARSDSGEQRQLTLSCSDRVTLSGTACEYDIVDVLSHTCTQSRQRAIPEAKEIVVTFVEMERELRILLNHDFHCNLLRTCISVFKSQLFESRPTRRRWKMLTSGVRACLLVLQNGFKNGHPVNYAQSWDVFSHLLAAAGPMEQITYCDPKIRTIIEWFSVRQTIANVPGAIAHILTPLGYHSRAVLTGPDDGARAATIPPIIDPLSGNRTMPDITRYAARSPVVPPAPLPPLMPIATQIPPTDTTTATASAANILDQPHANHQQQQCQQQQQQQRAQTLVAPVALLQPPPSSAIIASRTNSGPTADPGIHERISQMQRILGALRGAAGGSSNLALDAGIWTPVSGLSLMGVEKQIIPETATFEDILFRGMHRDAKLRLSSTITLDHQNKYHQEGAMLDRKCPPGTLLLRINFQWPAAKLPRDRENADSRKDRHRKDSAWDDLWDKRVAAIVTIRANKLSDQDIAVKIDSTQLPLTHTKVINTGKDLNVCIVDMERYRDGKSHYLQVVCPEKSCSGCSRYSLGRYFLARKDWRDTMLARLAPPVLSPGAVRASIVSEYRKNSGENQCSTQFLDVSLLSSVSLTRIALPMSSKACTHLQPFEWQDFCDFRPKSGTQCPVCDTPFSMSRDLYVNGYFLEILASAPKKVDCITVDCSSGTWSKKSAAEMGALSSAVHSRQTTTPQPKIMQIDDDGDDEKSAPIVSVASTRVTAINPSLAAHALPNPGNKKTGQKRGRKTQTTDIHTSVQVAADERRPKKRATSTSLTGARPDAIVVVL